MTGQAPLFPLCFLDRLRMATDGTGVTALVGAYGCPLRCAFCINSYTWREGTAYTWVTPAQLYDRVKQDNLYYLATGGGVTFGGGEPLIHASFISAFRDICPPAWHLCAESSLYVPQACVETAAGSVDHFFIDVKDMNPGIYARYTCSGGLKEIDNRLVKDNLTLLLSLVGPERITVRLPLIPGYNNEKDRDRSKSVLTDMGIYLFDHLTYRLPHKSANGETRADT